jgi:hypothetical protein
MEKSGLEGNRFFHHTLADYFISEGLIDQAIAQFDLA